jgi:predicted negative regulator of RcsB-dependent stress response
MMVKFSKNRIKICTYFYTVAMLVLSMSTAHANDVVTMRSGEHKTYSRLVFDWAVPFDYDSKKEEESLTVSFTKPAQLDSSKISIQTQSNIAGLLVLSNDPLRIKIGLPKASKFRVLKTSGKLIVDVYNPPKGKIKRNILSVKDLSKPKEKTQKVQSKPTDTGLTNEDKVDAAGISVGDVKAESESTPLESVAQEKLLKNPEVTPPRTAIDFSQLNFSAPKRHRVSGDNLISISSTGALALAAFELRDSLIIVTDRNDIIIKPQIGGPDADHVEPFEKLAGQTAQSFRANRLDGAHYEGKGGGLLWRLTVSDKPKNTAPASPLRKGATEGAFRGGSVFYPLENAFSVLDFKDPLTGGMYKIVSVDDAKSSIDHAASFVEFDVLRSPFGMAIHPKVDDLKIDISPSGVTISRPKGLAILPEDVMMSTRSSQEDILSQAGLDDPDFPQIYRFASWAKASSVNGKFEVGHLHKRKIATLSKLGGLSKGRRVESIIGLAREYLSHGYGAEAVGFVRYAENEVPELVQNPEFLALRGAARIFNNNDKAGFRDLLSSNLSGYKDVDYWKAVAVSHLGDWQQAGEIMPKDFSPLQSYPPMIRKFLTFGLSEIALRSGDNANARRLLKILEADKKNMSEHQLAAYDYLKGELYRQKDELEKTEKLWSDLAKGSDDFYRTRAGLALTRLHIESGGLKTGEAIDRLERLRYSWRGDDLETQVNFWLGRTYFEAEKFIKGLKIMRGAAELASTPEERKAITSEMVDVFVDLYTSDKLDEVSALDAAAVYEQFTELLPRDERGDAVIENLAQHLVKANVLTRAANLLGTQIKMRLNEAKDDAHAARVGLLLASIYLRDNKPEETLRMLRQVEDRLEMVPQDQQEFKDRAIADILIFRAKALADRQEYQRALELLERVELSPKVNSLRAEIAWEAQYWDDAAYALNDVVLDQNISLTRPLSALQEDLILNRAVALNLMDDRIGLANWREKYSVLMSQTNKTRLFDVVTRPRQNAGLADRETLLNSVSEVDLFKNFLDSYSGVDGAE